MLCTFIIPVAPYHLSLVERAAQSVECQTLPAQLAIVSDVDGRGAGYARNRGLAGVTTPFVSFLDADDWIEPTYLERMLAAYQQGRYVYCDDRQGDEIHSTPDCEVYLIAESWHCVTALVPTALAQAVGGFDESLPALEDKDFFLRLQANGVCGVRAPFPLLHYSPDGQRSKQFRQHPERDTIRQGIYHKYLGRARMGCNCGASGTITTTPNEKQEGDVLVRALYTPMKKTGRITGREYPRPKGTEDYQLYVDHRDAYAMPRDFQVMTPAFDAKAMSPDVDTIQQMALQALNAS